MADITVTPETFTYVKFEHGLLVDILTTLQGVVGLGDADIELVVQEQVPFGKAKVTGLDPIALDVESGALEDPLRPRVLSVAGSADILGQLLLQARDRLDESFGAPALDEPLGQAVHVAWSTYCVARLTRALAAAGDPIDGYHPQLQRRRYTFRTRHGFSDVADEQFERIWNADGLTFAEIVAISDAAVDAAAA